MSKNKTIGILGIWVIALAFLGFSDSLHRLLLIITGIVIAVIALKTKPMFKITEELVEKAEHAEKSIETPAEESKENNEQ